MEDNETATTSVPASAIETKETCAEGVTADENAPMFPPASAKDLAAAGKKEIRRITVPPNRFGPLKSQWIDIFTPIVSNLKLQIRMNMRTKQVEIQTSEYTEDIGALQRATDFVKAFLLGFEIKDAVALIRLDDLYVDSFDIEDVKRLAGDNMSRAIGRIAGKDGRTKILIENSTRTRIVLADKRVHILGSFNNIKVAKDAVVDLILGSPPGKVAASLRAKSARLNERW